MISEVRMPKLGMTMTEGKVMEWYKAVAITLLQMNLFMLLLMLK